MNTGTMAPGARIEPARPISPAPRLARVVRTRRHQFAGWPKFGVVLADAVALVGAVLLGARVATGPSLRLSAFGVAFTLAVFARYGLYSSRRVTSRVLELRIVFNAIAVALATLVVAAFAVQFAASRAWIAWSALFAFTLVACEREAARQVFAALRRRGRCSRAVVIVGANREGRALSEMLAHDRALGYRVLALVDDAGGRGAHAPQTTPVLSPIANVLDVIDDVGATGLIIATTAVDADRCNEIARAALDAGLHVELSSALCDIAPERLIVRPIGFFPVVCLEPVRRRGWRAVAKRTFDVVSAATVLLLALPLMVCVAVAVKLDSRGPALFRQQRVGKDGRLFTIYKFRTMATDAESRLPALLAHNEAEAPLFKMRDDPRVTRLGRFLRRWSLDELPQLWNVLTNDMSVVGPRPALPSEAAAWDAKLRQRLRVKPGLTGLWQVSGRSSCSFADYARLDLYYVDNWSLLADIGVVLRTIPTLIARTGAS